MSAMTAAEAAKHLRSLGYASEFMVLGARSVAEVHSDRIVLRTPEQPDFWFGNMVIFRGEPSDPSTVIARFQRDHPEAGHVTLGWDETDMVRGKEIAALEAMGFTIDETEVLALEGRKTHFDLPDGLTAHAISGDSDWAQVTGLQTDTGVELGYLREKHAPFIAQRVAEWRRATEAGRGAWFGAFDGAQLVADLGIFTDGRVARFQSVETRQSHRGRGICPALITRALAWVQSVAPDAIPVILADQNEVAGRIYRRCGFTPKERLIAAYRAPEGYRAGQ